MKTFVLKAQQYSLAGADDLVPGDRVKLVFVGPRLTDVQPIDCRTEFVLPWTFGGERMWAVVLEKRAGVYLGELRNRPIQIDGAVGDKFLFRPEHVVEAKRMTRGLRRLGMRILNWVMVSR